MLRLIAVHIKIIESVVSLCCLVIADAVASIREVVHNSMAMTARIIIISYIKRNQVICCTRL